jgi:hypothetical protein
MLTELNINYKFYLYIDHDNNRQNSE